MKQEDLIVILIGFIMGILIFVLSLKYAQQYEKTLILEQSLAEQIQEKQVYINILERTSNGD